MSAETFFIKSKTINTNGIYSRQHFIRNEEIKNEFNSLYTLHIHKVTT